jgi:4-hydroxybenzoate polyprenyltransferase
VATPKKLSGIFALIKLENTIFVLPFTYIGMLLARQFALPTFILITLALVFARGAAFTANRYSGFGLDAKNPKKKNFPSVSIYSKNDLIFIFVAFAVLFELCAYLLNSLAALLAPIVLVIVIIEPIAKRYTSHRHLTMGLVIGLGILGGYVGASGAIPTTLPPYILLFGYAVFSGGSDVVHTLMHVDFDRKNGLKTYPVKYGVEKAKQISKYLHYWASALFIEFGALLGSTAIVAAGALTLAIFFFEHRNLSEKSDRSIATTFFYYNALVSIVMLLSVIIFIYMH